MTQPVAPNLADKDAGQATIHTVHRSSIVVRHAKLVKLREEGMPEPAQSKKPLTNPSSVHPAVHSDRAHVALSSRSVTVCQSGRRQLASATSAVNKSMHTSACEQCRRGLRLLPFAKDDSVPRLEPRQHACVRRFCGEQLQVRPRRMRLHPQLLLLLRLLWSIPPLALVIRARL